MTRARHRRVKVPNATPARIAKALAKPYHQLDTKDIYIRAFEEAKGFVSAFLGYSQTAEDQHDSPILNYVVGMAHEIERLRAAVGVAEQTAAEHMGLADAPVPLEKGFADHVFEPVTWADGRPASAEDLTNPWPCRTCNKPQSFHL